MLIHLLWTLFSTPVFVLAAIGVASAARRLFESLARLDRHPALMPPRPSPRHGRDMQPMPGDPGWQQTILFAAGAYAPSGEIGDLVDAQDAARIRFRQKLPGERRRFWHACDDVRASAPQTTLDALARSIN